MAIDPYSTRVCKVELHCNNTILSSASGFLFRYQGKHYLITNWHVLSGRNAQNGQPLHEQHAIPDCATLKFSIPTEDGKTLIDSIHKVELGNDDDKQPHWFEHPTLGQKVDLAAIELKDLAPNLQNNCFSNEDFEADELIRIGDDAFVLGFPKGISKQGNLPLWKRASIATEPDFDVDNQKLILIDTATRQGMSGAPVVFLARGTFVNKASTVVVGEASVLLGVYSGRFGAEDEIAAQVGLCWKAQLIHEVLNGRKPGSYHLT